MAKFHPNLALLLPDGLVVTTARGFGEKKTSARAHGMTNLPVKRGGKEHKWGHGVSSPDDFVPCTSRRSFMPKSR